MPERTMRRAALVGFGTMGPGAAAVLSRGGIDVAVFDTDTAKLARADDEIDTAFAVLERIGGPAATKRGVIAKHDSAASCVADADIVLESVPEALEIKRKVFAELDRLAPDTCILASNTSGIPITQIQAAATRPGRVVGMHWSNPPHVIPIIEVIAGKDTSRDSVEATRALITSLGLLPIVVKRDVPGFVENRVLYAIMRECVALVERGVIEPEELDACVKWGIGYKLAVIGPLELLDVAGLDIYQAVSGYLNADLDARKDVSPMIAQRTARGDLGMKTGKGIYDYTPDRIRELRADRARKLVAVRRTLEGR
jgi:3-hydroxybutyryl-CoA dehydrogenase/5-formyl-3-hydroxy-2-methylpyridine 4-carboxylate dehydrogenase